LRQDNVRSVSFNEKGGGTMRSVRGGRYRVLSHQQLGRIHRAALDVLTRVGIQVGSEPFLAILSQAGCAVKDNGRVTMPSNVIEEALEKVPNRVLLYGRDEDSTLDLGERRVYLGTGGAAIHILDLESGDLRGSTLADLGDIAWLVENLENVHFLLRPVVARDVPPEVLDVNKFYTCLVNTNKHVMASASSPEKARDVIELAEIITGGQQALRDRPIISFVTSWMISPLKLDVSVADILLTAVKRGIPVALSSAPVTGSTAPATLAGLLVQVHAEELFGIVLTQAIRAGAPVLYGPVPAVADMRTMSYLGGAIESGLLNAACVQLADLIDVPIYSDAGLTDSKLPDIQAGYEKATNIMLVAMAGGNYIHHSAGMLESMLTVAYEQFVIDNDINGMALRALRGIEVSEDTLATGVIEEVGPGGNYLTQRHTIDHLRGNEYYTPATSDRRSRNSWMKDGGLDTRERATEIAREILAKERPILISPEIDDKIRARFNIVAPRRTAE
jgi:trimethylamine--corrinoid protein Co-methyltransferase